MKRGLLLLFLLPVAFGQYYEAQELVADVTISNVLYVQPEDSDYLLKKATVKLSFYPREDFRQRVEDVAVSPDYSIEGDAYVFEWDEPNTLELPFSVESRVKTLNRLPRITSKVDFPIKELGDEAEYIFVTPTIDYTDKRIMYLASDLGYGEDDLAVVVHKLGEWVNTNIEYDLNTKTSSASQKASWVIENQYGVCDELTNLFIGLCRALGIPARFVSGLSYTELELFDEHWSPHGWAEVYFPGYGWIPYDVTYGQMGYIDPTHIKLKDSGDANKSSTRYEWEGYRVDLETKSLQLETEVLEVKGRHKPLLEIDVSYLKDNVGFGSYNALAAEVYNPNDYYVPTELFVTRSEGMELLDDYSRLALFAPGETRREFWLFRLREGQEKNYIYNFTSRVYTARNASATAYLMSTERYKEYTRQEIQEEVDQLSEEQEKTYSRSVSLECSAGDVYYVGETAQVDCEIRNTGNVVLEGVQVCLDDCQEIDIMIGQTAVVAFEKELAEEGVMDLLVTAENSDVSKGASVLLEAWGRPGVDLSELEFPSQVRPDENFTISFRVSPRSTSLPQNVRIALSSPGFSKEWRLDELSAGRRYVLNVDGYSLTDVENHFRLLATYSDREGRTYSSKEEFNISVVDAGLTDRAIMLLGKINSGLQYDIAVVGIAVFVAGMVVGMIFRSRK